jgi:hypothetical protein
MTRSERATTAKMIHAPIATQRSSQRARPAFSHVATTALEGGRKSCQAPNVLARSSCVDL